MAVSGRPVTASARGVAGEDGGEDRLAGAVGAAVGGGKDVDRRRRGAALDAAVGQIEAGVAEVEEREIAAGVLGAATKAARRRPGPRSRPGSKRA